jgi:hypothetical protein
MRGDRNQQEHFRLVQTLIDLIKMFIHTSTRIYMYMNLYICISECACIYLDIYIYVRVNVYNDRVQLKHFYLMNSLIGCDLLRSFV